MIWPSDNAGIVLLILQNEGGWINNPSDRGGPTNYGITIDILSSWRKTSCTADDIRSLTIQEASEIYLSKYIVTPNFDQLTDIHLRANVVDTGVLSGPVMATEILQSSLGVVRDGVCGPQTLAAANALTDSRSVCNQVCVGRTSFLVSLAVKDQTQIQFLTGWISRALQFIQ